MQRWATDTWRSLADSVFPSTGLPGDGIGSALDPLTRDDRCSPTDIAAYLWSVVAARDLAVVTPEEAYARLSGCLSGLAILPRHPAGGMLFNWYRASTGALIPNGPNGRGQPFVSSVDNGWLAMALMIVGQAEPRMRGDTERLLARMDFGVFYDRSATARGGRLHGGFWPRRTRRETVAAAYLDGTPVVQLTKHHYDLLNSEPRIAGYVGMARGQLASDYYEALDAPLRHYRGREVVSTFGGSMFEALSPALFVPETTWAPRTWGRNLANTVALQREYAMLERGFAVWGLSPSACPPWRGRPSYAELGVPPIGLWDGYPSEWHGEPVITPHASAMALCLETDAATQNLSRLEDEYGCYGPGGFLDAVALRTRRTAERYLTLDQGLLSAGLAAAAGHPLSDHFCTPEVSSVLRPIVAARRW